QGAPPHCPFSIKRASAPICRSTHKCASVVLCVFSQTNRIARTAVTRVTDLKVLQFTPARRGWPERLWMPSALNGMRRLIPCDHTECTISSIEIILRPSLKNASVSDGPSNTIEEKKIENAVVLRHHWPQ
ncbi:hypothetical protein TcCL_Unassigned04952, partial [Trypanosoma cruzi]